MGFAEGWVRQLREEGMNKALLRVVGRSGVG